MAAEKIITQKLFNGLKENNIFEFSDGISSDYSAPAEQVYRSSVYETQSTWAEIRAQ